MRYSRAANLFFNVPLAILPAKADEIVTFWRSKLAGAALDFDGEQPDFEVAFRAAGTGSGGGRGDRVAIIPVRGVLSQRMNLMSAISGGTSTEEIASAFREAVNNPDVAAVLFDIDSPGGSSFGLTELANEIMDARGSKPLVGIANSTAASGAYWLGAALDYLYATPGALVGSVGVYMMHTDLSQASEAEGIKVTFISAGAHKTRGNEFEPLSAADVAHFQSLVDDTYDQFIRDIARGRRVSLSKVRNGFGQGDVLTARQALDAEMVDGIKTFEQVVALAPTLRPRKTAMAAGSAAEEDIEIAASAQEQGEELADNGRQLWSGLLWRYQQAKDAALSAPAGG